MGTRQPPAPVALGPGQLDPTRLAQLESSTADFRARQSGANEAKKLESREWAARKILVQLDEADKGTRFHPLHVIPTAPIQTIPVPLLRLVWPEHGHDMADARKQWMAGRNGVDDTYGHEDGVGGTLVRGGVAGKDKDENRARADALRDQMRRDALESVDDSALGQEHQDGPVAFGDVAAAAQLNQTIYNEQDEIPDKDAVDLAPVDWSAQVEGVEKVMAMDVSRAAHPCHA